MDGYKPLTAIKDIQALNDPYFGDGSVPYSNTLDANDDELTSIRGAFAYQDTDEPENKVRHYFGAKSTFWYKGAWYYIEDLPEGSDAKKAYDEYMRSRR